VQDGTGVWVSSVKDRLRFLATAEDVDAFLEAHADSAVFKAGTCHKTQETFARVQEHLESRGDLALGVIRVVEARAASRRLADVTGIAHESPQIVLFRSGRPVFERNNWSITGESVAEALREFFSPAPSPREVAS
jgi:bacillithiol system protein YtxJ